jgi:hypothetical protein
MKIKFALLNIDHFTNLKSISHVKITGRKKGNQESPH